MSTQQPSLGELSDRAGELARGYGLSVDGRMAFRRLVAESYEQGRIDLAREQKLYLSDDDSEAQAEASERVARFQVPPSLRDQIIFWLPAGPAHAWTLTWIAQQTAAPRDDVLRVLESLESDRVVSRLRSGRKVTWFLTGERP